MRNLEAENRSLVEEKKAMKLRLGLSWILTLLIAFIGIGVRKSPVGILFGLISICIWTMCTFQLLNIVVKNRR